MVGDRPLRGGHQKFELAEVAKAGKRIGDAGELEIKILRCTAGVGHREGNRVGRYAGKQVRRLQRPVGKTDTDGRTHKRTCWSRKGTLARESKGRDRS